MQRCFRRSPVSAEKILLLAKKLCYNYKLIIYVVFWVQLTSLIRQEDE